MAVLTSNNQRAGCYLGESAALNIVNEEIKVPSGVAKMLPGTILAIVASGTTVVTPGAVVSGSGGVPGNGSIGVVTADVGAPEGTYQVVILNPAANAGAFEVRKPDGTIDGNGTVGVAYNGTINFTLADGSTDFVEDDRIPVVVSRPNGESYYPHDPAAADGRQNAAGILYDTVDASTGAKKAVATVNGPASIFDNRVIWKAGITADQKADAIKALAAKGLKFLPQRAS
ncbi:head decoration protein [Rhizorhabdus sp.]|uniref:head decoration protein n=1 Tax=Rhizorhabdus sp. TaxID=1968843 RepID=UPI0035B05EB8